ncbi:MAG: choice-of-anchor Q domain-containing protein, partial [Terracidiphilus sp.]
AHQGFDPRPFTVQEIGAARRNAMRHEHSPTLAQIAGNTGNAPWTEVETIGGVAPAALDGTVPVLLRAHATGSGQDDLLALNGAQQEIAVVRHPASANSAFAAASGVVTRSPLSSGGVIAAIAQRASPQGADGIITLKEGSIHPEITTPAQSNTMYVNTTADSLDANNANRCTQSDTTDTCSLRDAITYANADASVNIGGGTSDTIMIPAGTYNLTYQASQVDANNNAVTHLEILGPMTLVGDPGGVTINGQSNDVIFSINPGPYGSYNPSGDSYVFDTTFENLNITGGQNNDNPANSGTGLPNNVGGGINWDANGTGNLTLTSCTVDSNTNGWGDGGGIWFFNSAGGGSGTLTINGGSVSSNQTSEEGGGIYQATAPAGFAATNVTFSSNTASPTVNTSDPGGAAGADYGGGLFFSAIPSGSGIPQSTIVGGSITSNFADGDGGGIYTTQGISITGGTSISSNSATGSGGGIFHDADATTTVTAANITSNSATHTGGGITVGTETAANGNAFTIANSRIFGNTSTNGVNGLSAGEPSSSGAGAVTATENWWGCNAGPVTSADGCDQATLYDPSTGSMSVTPNIVLTLGVSPDPVNEGSALQLDAAVNTNSSSGTVPGGPGALQGLTVDFAATVGAFSASPTATIDGTGNATTSVTPTSSGAGTATATLDNQTVTQSFSVASGAPTITSANAASFTSGTVGAFTVTTTGTPTPALSETGALPSGVTFVDNGNGTATISGTAGLATTYTITITAANGVSPNATQSFTLTVNPGAATHLVIPGGPAPFYTAFDINIYAYDAAGNLATSYNGTVALTSSDPGFVNLGPFTLANGQTVATAVLKTAGVDTITATDVSNASITGTGSFTVQPGAATHFGLSAPTAAYAGSPINFTVTAYDLYGNVATSYSGTVHFTSTDASAVLPADSTLTNGVGTFSATLMTVGSQTISATDTITSSITGMSGSIAVTIPNYVVTTATDDAGAASNCTVQTTPGSGTDATCSLRDALLAAGNAGSGSITFDSTKFASATSITLTNGTLNVPSNTSVTGPTTGSAATLTYLVTVSGNNAYTVFTVNAGVAGAAISNLVVTNGNTQFGGGGILNQGTLLVTGSAISGNTAIAPNGGGIYNASTGTLTLTNSTISGNTLQSGGIGDGIYNNGGTLTLTNSTVSGNNLPNGNGAGILSNNDGTLTLTNSTISGNSGAGGIGGGIYSVNSTVTITNTTISGNTASEAGGIFFAGTGSITLANTIVAGDTATTDPDFEGAATDGGYNLIGNGSGLTGITNGTNGDQVGTSASPLNPLLAALANYGGPTQTMLPLLGSPAICAINPSSATGTDQRGLPRTTTYGPTTCQDAGAVETNYALSFTTNPAATETNGVSFPAAVTLTESANPISGISIPVTLNGGGTLAGSPVSATTGATGVATYTLTVSNPTALSNLTLAATLPAPPSITTTSSDFDLTEPAPTVTTISPTSGPSAGGIIVTITGTNFTGATAVEFGSTSATSYTVVSPNQITATSPAGTGTVDITVSTPGGTSVKSTADQFTYRPPPAVTSISPKSGPPAGGTTVTISGTNFVTGDTVSFGLVTAIVPVTLTATQISVVSPPGTGTVDVTVVDPNGISSATSAADKFTYLAVSVTAMPISATAGTAFSGQVATFNENTGNLDSVSAFTSTISWGDGTVPSVGTIIQPGGVGTPYAVTGTHTYASGGSYSFNVTVTPVAGNSVSGNSTATVSQAPAITSASGTTYILGTLGSFLVTTTGFPTPSLSETGALPGGLVFVDNGNGTATLAGTPSAGGIYPITIRAANGVGTNATQSFTLTVIYPVAVTANAISPVAEAPFSSVVGSFISANNRVSLVTFSATVDWGDGTISTAIITQPGGAGTAYLVTGTHTYVASGIFNFIVTVTPAVGPAATGTNTATVAPAPATHFMITAPASASVGGPFNVSVTAFDALNNPTIGYYGTVHFTSTDPSAVLPADATLTNGVGTFSATLMIVGNQTITATDTVASSITGTTGAIAVTIPSFVVTNTDDSGAGSLRAALASAASAGSGNITFDPSEFATAQTIMLTSGTLNIPSNTTITGPTTGNGATLTNLVTVDGGGSSRNFSIFSIAPGVTAAINNLILTHGYIQSQGGAIATSGNLTITNCSFVDNYAAGYIGTGNGGGAIFAGGTLTISGSTFSGNMSAPGGAILADSGSVTISSSTFSGNSVSDNKAGSAIYINNAAVTLNSSTFSGNPSTNAYAIFNSGTLTAENTIISGNAGGDCDAGGASTCPTNGSNGNIVGVSSINLAPLGNYGGPTQTMIPLPGSVAICAINPSTATGTDQRGLPRTTTYGSNTCQDSGAVESNYSLTFS